MTAPPIRHIGAYWMIWYRPLGRYLYLKTRADARRVRAALYGNGEK